MNRFGAHRPLLERPERRSAEREKRLRAEVARQSFDYPPAPAVERMVGPIARLRAGGERVPARAPGHAGKDDRPNIGKRALPLAVLESERAARNETA
jgi:hypothetical protein